MPSSTLGGGHQTLRDEVQRTGAAGRWPFDIEGYDTKVDLSKSLELPYNDDYFSVPPHAPHGQIPKLGSLHPSMVRIAAAAFAATR